MQINIYFLTSSFNNPLNISNSFPRASKYILCSNLEICGEQSFELTPIFKEVVFSISATASSIRCSYNFIVDDRLDILKLDIAIGAGGRIDIFKQTSHMEFVFVESVFNSSSHNFNMNGLKSLLIVSINTPVYYNSKISAFAYSSPGSSNFVLIIVLIVILTLVVIASLIICYLWISHFKGKKKKTKKRKGRVYNVNEILENSDDNFKDQSVSFEDIVVYNNYLVSNNPAILQHKEGDGKEGSITTKNQNSLNQKLELHTGTLIKTKQANLKGAENTLRKLGLIKIPTPNS